MDKDRSLWAKCKSKRKYADDWVCGYCIKMDNVSDMHKKKQLEVSNYESY